MKHDPIKHELASRSKHTDTRWRRLPSQADTRRPPVCRIWSASSGFHLISAPFSASPSPVFKLLCVHVVLTCEYFFLFLGNWYCFRPCISTLLVTWNFLGRTWLDFYRDLYIYPFLLWDLKSFSCWLIIYYYRRRRLQHGRILSHIHARKILFLWPLLNDDASRSGDWRNQYWCLAINRNVAYHWN